MSKFTTLFIDLDGTLLPSKHFYHKPQLRCAEIIIDAIGPNCIDPGNLITRAYDISKEIMREDLCKNHDHFQLSFVKLYQQLAVSKGDSINVKVCERLYHEAGEAFRHDDYQLYPDVFNTLMDIKQRKVLVTLGNKEIQTKKIDATGIHRWLDEIEIVGAKTESTYQNLLDKYQVSHEEVAMIGDNFKLDIQPSMNIGMWAFHVTDNVHDANKLFLFLKRSRYQAIPNFSAVEQYLK